MGKTVKVKQNSLSRRIVSLTVFLDALFLVIIIAILSFVYFSTLNSNKMSNAQSESLAAVSALNAFTNETFSDLTQLSEDQTIIDYLLFLQTSTSPIITDTFDENYLLFQAFETKLNSLIDYNSGGIYDFIFVASPSDCSTGVDGCYVGSDNNVSDETWELHQRPWFLDLGTRTKIVSLPYEDNLTGNNVITFVSEVHDELNNLIGYVGIDVLVSNLSEAIYTYDYFAEDNSKSLAIFVVRDGIFEVLHFSDTQYPDYTLLNENEVSSQDSVYGFESGMKDLIQNMNTEGVMTLDVFHQTYFVSTSVLSQANWYISVLILDDTGLGMEVAFLLLLGAIIVLMIIVSIILSKKINRTLSPINNILESIEQIKNGNYDVSVQVDENNELKYVADALNIMSKEIGKQVDLVYQTYVYDHLTGLKNRKAVHAEIDEEILSSNEKVAICLLDIDNLKNINVTKGQNIADELLKSIGNKLKSTLRNKELIYYNSANEFVFIVPNVKQLDGVESEILRVIESFQEPIVIKNVKIEAKLHIGVSIYPSDGKNMSELMKKCDTALYKARESAGVLYVFYNDQLTREVNYRTQINEELSTALERNQLYLKYQPLIDNKNEIYGFEALVRWNSPTLGEISPQIFIANAEESHMIIPIGTWILREGCLTQVRLKKMFNKSFVMSINVSPVQIIQKDFLDILRRTIKETDIDPKDLVLEITEGVLIESTLYLEETINFLHNIGAKIALDDFGTGYASLTYLRQIPFDNLKIDKSFVDGIFESKKDHSIIGTIVDLVHNLDMKVIAEGVETRKQYEYLKQISTDVFQGFIFSKALDFQELIKFIDQFYKVAKSKRVDVFASKDYKN